MLFEPAHARGSCVVNLVAQCTLRSRCGCSSVSPLRPDELSPLHCVAVNNFVLVLSTNDVVYKDDAIKFEMPQKRRKF